MIRNRSRAQQTGGYLRKSCPRSDRTRRNSRRSAAPHTDLARFVHPARAADCWITDRRARRIGRAPAAAKSEEQSTITEYYAVPAPSSARLARFTIKEIPGCLRLDASIHPFAQALSTLLPRTSLEPGVRWLSLSQTQAPAGAIGRLLRGARYRGAVPSSGSGRRRRGPLERRRPESNRSTRLCRAAQQRALAAVTSVSRLSGAARLP